METGQEYRNAYLPSGWDNPGSRLSGLRTSHSILPSRPVAPIASTRPQDLEGSVDSLLAEQIEHLPSNSITESESLEDLAQPRQANALHLAPNPLEHLNMRTRSLQLPVKHTNAIGTQVGILLPKYHVHAQSKCIMCRDCGIFFSHDSFLRHLHDNIGRRRECQSTMLELGIDNPGVQQMKLWQDFLSKLGGQSKKRPRTSSYDPMSGVSVSSTHSLSDHSDANPNTHVLYPRRPARHYSPISSTHKFQTSPRVAQLSNPQEPGNQPAVVDGADSGSISALNRNIQQTVNDSERLLKETTHYLASTEKSRHRRTRSKTIDLNKPAASRNLFDSEVGQQRPAIGSNQTGYQQVSANLHSNNLDHDHENGSETVRLPRDTRQFASGDHLHIRDGGGVDGSVSTQQDSHIIDDHGAGSAHTTTQNGSSSMQFVARGENDASSRFQFPSNFRGRISEQDIQDCNKGDPVFILQTAQELLSLASHRIQLMKEEMPQSQGVPPSPGRDNEFLQLYHEERSKRRKYEAQLQELQEALKEEQKQRKELEIQLRALKLQR